jgi:SAM-dependent methyltransferase
MIDALRAQAAERASMWKEVSRSDRASWYLDPIVAWQKRSRNVGLVRGAGAPHARLALKTDAFEEAYGEDSPLADLLPVSDVWIVMDAAERIVLRAAQRKPSDSVRYLAADVRRLPFRPASLDLIFSNSTLDHFGSRAEFCAALKELGTAIRPDGTLVLTTDNPWNPCYWPLRWFCRSRIAPFPLGYAPGPARLKGMLEEAGFDVVRSGLMIHNPRGLSTVLFLLLRRALGRRADRPIRAALAAFEWLSALPTRRFTACYLTALAVRRP